MGFISSACDENRTKRNLCLELRLQPAITKRNDNIEHSRSPIENPPEPAIAQSPKPFFYKRFKRSEGERNVAPGLARDGAG